MLQQTTEKPRKTAIHQRQTLEIQLKCTRMRPITDIPISYSLVLFRNGSTLAPCS